MKKRILPALLALCMVMSLLPVAFAAHDNANCKVEGCTTEGCTGACTKASPCQACQDAKCAACQEDKDEGSEEAKPEEKFTCDCKGTHSQWIDNTDEKNPVVRTTCTNEVDKEGDICATCQKTAACNPCEVEKCGKLKDHTDKHGPEAACSGDKQCGASKDHKDTCPYRCTALDKVMTVDTTTGEPGKTAAKCTLSASHGGPHNNADCINAVGCGASTHFEGKDAVKDDPETEDKDETAAAVPGCPSTQKKYQCGVGGCDLPAGHTGVHKNTVCLGYNANGKCDANLGGEEASDKHIAGCDHYDCNCSAAHTGEGFKPTAKECSSKPGCTYCNEWNAYVSGLVTEYNKAMAEYNTAKAKYDSDKAAYDKLTEEEKKDTTKYPVPVAPTAPEKVTAKACDCKDCRPNPAMGAVVDENGNVVTDPTEPTEPEAPKAEDFTDMEDWMAADVQVALDKGWLQGNGDGTFNGRGVTTGATIAAVLARMDGEEITGTTWAQDALAWAEDQDVFEGVELTGDSMARKDLVLVLWRMAGTPESEHELDFTDVDGLEGDHLTAMKWAVENGIVKGNGDGTVTPDGSVSRAALCAMLARYDALEK